MSMINQAIKEDVEKILKKNKEFLFSLAGKKVLAILKEKDLTKEMPEDLRNLIKKMVYIQRHMEKNKHDQAAKRGLLLTNSKIRRLVKYYQRTERLPTEWKLDMNRLKIYLE